MHRKKLFILKFRSSYLFVCLGVSYNYSLFGVW